MNEPETIQFLADALEVGGPEATLRKEARRQESFVTSDTLPATMSLALWRWSSAETLGLARTTLEKWGVKFLGPVEGDPTLERVELSTGWKKVATYEPRLVMLVDNHGRERARIVLFSNHKELIIQPRYGISEMRIEEIMHGEGPISVVATDGGTVTGGGRELFATPPTPPIKGMSERYGARREAAKMAEAWLDERYPNWRDPLAYWN